MRQQIIQCSITPFLFDLNRWNPFAVSYAQASYIILHFPFVVLPLVFSLELEEEWEKEEEEEDEEEGVEEAEKEAVLVVSPILRPWLAKLLRRASQEVRVLSYREVPDDQSIKIIQTIELEEKSENGVEE